MSLLDHYRTFVTICELESLSAAAKQLHRSPSAVSKQMTQLEHSLGTTLLDRSTRVVAVTDIGQGFYVRCREILAAVERAEQEIAEAQGEIRGKLVLSIPKILLHTRLMQALSEFCSQFPAIKLDLRVSNEIEQMLDQRIDFAFRIGRLQDSRLHAVKLDSLQPVFCASPRYLKQHGTPDTLDGLANHEVLVPTAVNLSEALRDSTGQFDDFTLDLSNHHTTDDATALYQAIINGMGIGVFMRQAIVGELNDKRLLQVLPEQNLGSKPMQLVYHKQGRLPAKLAAFRDFVRSYYRP